MKQLWAGKYLILWGILGFAAAANSSAINKFSGAAKAIVDTLRKYIYDPQVLDTPQNNAIEQRIEELAQYAITQDEFISGFNKIWVNGPVSHVQLQIATESAEAAVEYLDNMIVGDNGVELTWEGDFAVLTVNTMMGLDTVERIKDAYQVITDRKAKALIIDLRSNDGGAFAVNPLVSHILTNPLDAGFFLSQKWTRDHNTLPTPDNVQATDPWQGWSIQSFWRDVQDNDITRIMFVPVEPRFEGPVFVLTSKKTASAAELGADALLASGRAVLVGEPTAGQMLSQKMYDIEGGFQLYLPIADYFSIRSGRIEGNGVSPTVWVEAEEALEKALSLARDAAGND